MNQKRKDAILIKMYTILNDFDAVIFDMDGVIFDSEKACLECWIEISKKYGIKDIEKQFLACAGTDMRKTKEIMLAAYGSDFPYDCYAKEASRNYHEKYDGGKLPMKTGVTYILDFLKRNGKQIALASSTRKQTVINQLRAANILEYFDEVITGDMVTRSKPEPDIYLLACERVGVAPERAYAIEDSYNGIRSASSAQLRTIMVPDLLPANEEMMKLSEAVLPKLEDVAAYLSDAMIKQNETVVIS